jgi:extracellular factor (EF) 3-hydroxypalmitic acid methyl ester biosynthesis protein
MDPKFPMAGGEKDSIIICRNSQGVEVRATPLRMTRHLVVFEVYNPYSILQLSEVLSDFQIIVNERLIYSGRAVVSNLLNTGIIIVCEATLGEEWLDVDLFSPVSQRSRLQAEVVEFLKEWQKIYTVQPDFKVVVADLQTLLVDLRRWMEQVELGVRSQPSGDRIQIEREIIQDLREPITPSLVPLFQRFEETCSTISDELRPAHGSYVKRQLHPVVLCAPFFYRSFRKPLGYAGDYEMVSMMMRDPLEGSSMFAKTLNMFFLETPPVIAHRNRITYLVAKLREEVARAAAAGRRARIFNLGCGPAQEIREFIRSEELSNHADFLLLDFNDETLQHTGRVLEELKRRYNRSTTVSTTKKSVHQILKEAGRPSAEMIHGGYDLVYCAGLFDYLTDRICKRLMSIFYDLTSPGGIVVATNVDSSNPSRNWMEYVVEWHLVYRDSRQLRGLAPEQSAPGAFQVISDQTGVNIFIEVRKPDAL